MRIDESDDDVRGQTRSSNDSRGRNRINIIDDTHGDLSEDDDEWDPDDIGDASNYETDEDKSSKGYKKFSEHNSMRWKQYKVVRTNKNGIFDPKKNSKSSKEMSSDDSVSVDMLSELEEAMWESDDGELQNERESRIPGYDYKSTSDEENCNYVKRENEAGMAQVNISPDDNDSCEETSDFEISRNGMKNDIGK